MRLVQHIRQQTLNDALIALHSALKASGRSTVVGAGIYHTGYLRKRPAGPYWMFAAKAEHAAHLEQLIEGEIEPVEASSPLDLARPGDGLSSDELSAIKHGTIAAWNEMNRSGVEVVSVGADAALDGGTEPVLVVFARGPEGRAMIERAHKAGWASESMLDPQTMHDDVAGSAEATPAPASSIGVMQPVPNINETFTAPDAAERDVRGSTRGSESDVRATYPGDAPAVDPGPESNKDYEDDDQEDREGVESFPASDPPGNY